VLINKHCLPLLNNIFNISVKQILGAQGRMHMVQQTQIGRLIEALILFQQTLFDQNSFYFAVTLFG
jgi:hypothetical protein